MRSRFGFIVALAILLLGATALSVVSVSAQAIPHGLLGRYWDETFFGVYPLIYDNCDWFNMPPLGPYPQPDMVQIDPTINFGPPSPWNWRPFGPEHQFSVKWTGYIDIREAGIYWFRLTSDDGSWLYIADTLVVSNPGYHPPSAVDGSIGFKVPGSYKIVIDFYETCDVECGIVFYWKPPGATDWEIVPQSVLVPEPLPNPTGGVPELSLALPMVISLAAAALFIGKRRWIKTTL